MQGLSKSFGINASVVSINKGSQQTLAQSAGHGHFVCVIDTDSEFCEFLAGELFRRGILCHSFASTEKFLSTGMPCDTACIILDLHLSAHSDFDFQQQLRSRDIHAPVIFLSAAPDVPKSVAAMKNGAHDVLLKPVNPDSIAQTTLSAIDQFTRRRTRKLALSKIRERFETLTPRERDVLPLVVGGLLNKQAAAILGIAEITIQVHRAQIMRKMEATSLPDLVRMAVKLGLPYVSSYQEALVHVSRSRCSNHTLSAHAV